MESVVSIIKQDVFLYIFSETPTVIVFICLPNQREPAQRRRAVLGHAMHGLAKHYLSYRDRDRTLEWVKSGLVG